VFLVRMEDLDRKTSSKDHESRQLADLASLGLEWDEPVVRQSERFDLYEDAIARLTAAGLTYPCYCTRREIREAASAPHGGVAGYPGTCRDLDTRGRAEHERSGRRPALRLRADAPVVTVVDGLAGPFSGPVDDIVLRRNDGVPAYHVAVVVDDALQGVTQVVRGDDLLGVTPSQVYLQRLLGLPTPAYLHVPLVLGADGERLAKRHGAVTLAALRAAGTGPEQVLAMLGASLGLCDGTAPVTLDELQSRFYPARLSREAWIFSDPCHPESGSKAYTPQGSPPARPS
jgi:glutamyl-tRNA synthetase